MAACFAFGRHKNYDISLELQIETINFLFNACDYIFIVCYYDGEQTEKSVLAAENDSKDGSSVYKYGQENLFTCNSNERRRNVFT